MDTYSDLTEMGRAIMSAINEILKPCPSNVTGCNISDVLEKLVQTHKGTDSVLSKKSKHAWNMALIDLNKKEYIESNHLRDSSGKQNALVLTTRGLNYVNYLNGL